MKIGFIGYGSMTEALASKWVGKHELFIGGRNPEKANAVASKLGDDIPSGTSREAAEFGNVVVLSVVNTAVFDALKSAGADEGVFEGKTLVDINNPCDLETFVANIDGEESLAERIAAAAPGAQVTKAFNLCQATVWKMADPVFDGRRLVVPFCGGDDDAKAKTAQLIKDVGCEAVDLGDLIKARNLEGIARVVIQLLFSGRDPHTVFNLIQPEVKPI
jgi:predicted dinucleotide-binding enzyme